MNNIKNIIVAAGLLALASCAGHSVRLSGGVGLTELHGRTEGIHDTAPGGEVVRGRVELNRPAGGFDRLTAGIYVDVGSAGGFNEQQSIDSEHLAGGALFRYHFTDEGSVRPFAEVRAGYRHTWLDVGGERGNGGGLDAGGGLGLDFGPVFLMVDYSSGLYSIDEFHARTDEFSVMLGGTINF